MRTVYTVTIRPRRLLAGLAGLAVAVAGLAVVTFLVRAPLLGWIGGQLVHDDRMAPSDVIVVLSGGTPAREIEAADLYRGGYAPRVVLTAGRPRAGVVALRRRGVHVPDLLEERLRYLHALGVPRGAVTVMGEPVSSTMQESELIAAWVERHEYRRVILVTSGYHTARARWVFARALADTGATLLVRGDTVEPFDPDLWWRDRNMLRNGLFEWQKLIFYRLWYR